MTVARSEIPDCAALHPGYNAPQRNNPPRHSGARSEAERARNDEGRELRPSGTTGKIALHTDPKSVA